MVAEFISTALMTFVDEQRAANEAIRNAARSQAPIGSIDPAAIRQRRLYDRNGAMKPLLSATAQDDLVMTPFGDVLTRCHPGRDPERAIVHFHGGGWAFGSIYEQDWLLEQLAARTGATVYSVDYPLAPESQLPHATAVAAATLEATMASHVGSAIAVVGESAGAHIALSSILKLTPALRSRVCAMSLAYGIYDLSMTPSQIASGDEFIGLSTPWLRYFYSLTLPGLSVEERGEPRHSPLNAELRDLPPALLSVGQLDPLLDDSMFLFERLQAAGNDTSLRVYPEAPHGFNHLKTKMATAANDAVATFLTSRFDRWKGSGTRSSVVAAS